MKPAIVVVTYNRPVSLNRLLSFLSRAVFGTADINLVISIDYQSSQMHDEVVKIAKDFDWKYGFKKIIEHKKNLGLKEHVLRCGDLSEEYGAVIMLEDDIVISPYFYNYAVQAINVYNEDINIAGISLYGSEWSQVASRSFCPAQNGSDIYFFQHAQSWGQIWCYKMWREFKEWYFTHKDLKIDRNIPDNVRNWSNKSWLKYHIWYCVEKNKYFVYPYVSLSTNFSDLGEHLKGNLTYFQVPLLAGEKAGYNMPKFNLNSVRYDIFFEREGLGVFLDIEDNELCIDLYGVKKNRQKKRYWLTSTIANFKIVKSFALQLRPHELNIIFGIEGSEIFLYDTHVAVENQAIKVDCLKAKRTLYDIREVPSVSLIQVVKYRILKRIRRELKYRKI